MRNLVKQLLKSKALNQKKLAKLKRVWAKKHRFMPKNTQILTYYKSLIKKGQVKANRSFESCLRLKKIRTLSGVAPVAVLTRTYPCPGNCLYCPTENKIPKSYLSDEPAVMRAQQCRYDPYLQVKLRLKQLYQSGHTTDKVELIVMGGTWSALPRDYKIKFIVDCFSACNQGSKIQNSKFAPSPKLWSVGDKIQNYNLKFKILRDMQRINEKARHRIVGLTLETRPDWITIEEIKLMRKLGCTRVEIGVQSIYDDVLRKVKRGHTVEETIKATQLLKDAGFKVCYHLMPNLPGSDLKRDLQMFKTIFTDERFKPDMLKIYPCVVTKQAKLYDWWKKGKYKAYSDEELIDLLIKIKSVIPEWVRINRLVRDIPISHIVAGTKVSNLREVLQKRLKEKGLRCNCIRCREIKSGKDTRISSLILKIIKYKASGGEEYFLQFVDENNRLYAILRLRIPSQIFSKEKHFLPVLQDAAIIRELHTYGEALPIGTTHSRGVRRHQAPQHKGLGKTLIAKAEEITKKKGLKKIAVISGVGAQDYYRKLGYKLKEAYMVKSL